MDNEVKVETKKKGNVLFTLFACIMTGVIVFLATNIGQKASKTVDPDTPKKNEVTSNVESNTTSNVESNITSNVTSNATVETKLSEAEALTIGKSLYTKAASVFPTNGVIVEAACTHGEGGKYDCTALYNKVKTIFATNNVVSNATTQAATNNKNIYDYFTLNNGKYMASEGGIGVTCQTTTTLAIKSIEENKIVYTATRVSDANSITDDFEIVKENDTWKVSKYVYTACANTLK